MAVVVLGGLVGAFLYSALGAQASVIGVAAPVAFGEQIEASDLVEVSAADDPGLDPIPYADVDQVIGMTAATDLIAGSLLTMGALTEDPIPGPGQELVPIALQTSQLPATGLRPRDEVLFVETAAGDGQTATSAQGDGAPAPVAQTSTGTVLRVGQPTSTGVVVVDVLVDSGDGADLARLAADGRIALVVLPRGG
ncbi:MAG: flagellar biosynthesis protein FlgA [Actinomycetota bacterium]|nr:flagellar biosynthesis protein FlgA [Actinomycetota bacterium]